MRKVMPEARLRTAFDREVAAGERVEFGRNRAQFLSLLDVDRIRDAPIASCTTPLGTVDLVFYSARFTTQEKWRRRWRTLSCPRLHVDACLSPSTGVPLRNLVTAGGSLGNNQFVFVKPASMSAETCAPV